MFWLRGYILLFLHVKIAIRVVKNRNLCHDLAQPEIKFASEFLKQDI